MKLYYSPGACSMASHIMLKELGIDSEYEAVDLKAHQTKAGKDFYQINPKGYVPALEIAHGNLLTEGTAILLYLSELKPMVKVDRYRLVEWLVYVATELHKNFGPLFSKASSPEVVQAAKEKLGKRFDLVEKHLQNREFLLESGFSAADAYLFTVLNWCPKLGVDLSQWKNLSSFVKHIQSRPAIQQTMKEEGVLK